jgi:gluconate 2-dehydrogenase gamma chain
MERREMMKVLGTLPLAGWALTTDEIADAATHTQALLDVDDQQPTPSQARPPAANYTAKFFTALEWRTVRVLADIVMPRDARSGSATDAGVPQFMDFVMTEYPDNQARMRDGLGWLNAESRSRFGLPFPDAKPAERIAIVEDIAWPGRARPAHQPGVRFFSAFRDLTASGFFTSRVGVKDIGYMGNVPQSSWAGCSAAAERHIKVS